LFPALAAAQSVEHYEISRYGTLVAGAKLGGDTVSSLRETFRKNANRLSQLAESKLNREAVECEASFACH
jgi:ferritin-like metal-binding protein YciE